MPIPLKVLLEPPPLFSDLPEAQYQCSCFGGTDDIFEEDQ